MKIYSNYKSDYKAAKTGDEAFDLYLRLLMVTDYISGMSDEFAIRTFEDVFVPRKWHVL